MDEQSTAGDSTETIELDRFLKLAMVVQSGGEAKVVIRSGEVLVNGVVETRRGRKLRPGDVVHVHGEDYVIESDSAPNDNSSEHSET